MNREIKFRAWDIKGKFYKYPKLWDNSMPSNWNIHYVLEQFTGLSDKNGKEIYEGDILECSHFNPSIYEVEFIEGAFVLTNKLLKRYPLDISHIEDSAGKHFRVIGNNKENPELIQL